MKKREIQVVAARQNLRQAKGGGNDKQTINTGLLGDQTPA
jgi:hypothetical protein